MCDFPKKLLEVIGADKLEKYGQEIVLPAERVGFTGYIDRIKKSDFPANKFIIFGHDIYGRFFVSFLINKLKLSEDYYDYRPCVFTIFQRYTDNSTYFVNGGDYLFGTSNDHGIIDNQQLQTDSKQWLLLFRLLEKNNAHYITCFYDTIHEYDYRILL